MTNPTDRIRQILERHHPYGQSDHARHVAEDIVAQLDCAGRTSTTRCGM
jgi:hypothetical protein